MKADGYNMDIYIVFLMCVFVVAAVQSCYFTRMYILLRLLVAGFALLGPSLILGQVM
jgi:hypothetical protein